MFLGFFPSCGLSACVCVRVCVHLLGLKVAVLLTNAKCLRWGKKTKFKFEKISDVLANQIQFYVIQEKNWSAV